MSICRGFISAAMTIVLAVACSSPAVVVPPVSPEPTGRHHVGKFVWYDLLTDDLAAAQQFYSELFGWEFREDPDGSPYVVILREGTPIGGVVHTADLEDELDTSQWVSWLSVADVDRAVTQVREAGGVVHREPRELDYRGRFAVVTDPGGALVVLVRASTGDPPDAEAQVGEWLWTELWTDDPQSSMTFYEELVGYQREAIDAGVPLAYHILHRDDAPRAGVMQIPWEGVRPNWLPYVRVADPDAIVTRVESLGGLVLLPPSAELRDGSVAIIRDPTGAALTVQRWPPQAGGD